MTRLAVFFAVLLTLCVTDIILMKKRGLYREMIPYIILSTAAGIAAVLAFTGTGSIMGLLLKILNISE